MTEGIAGLRRDKTRPSRILRLPTAVLPDPIRRLTASGARP
jgi:hypothetical protein